LDRTQRSARPECSARSVPHRLLTMAALSRRLAAPLLRAGSGGVLARSTIEGSLTTVSPSPPISPWAAAAARRALTATGWPTAMTNAWALARKPLQGNQPEVLVVGGGGNFARGIVCESAGGCKPAAQSEALVESSLPPPVPVSTARASPLASPPPPPRTGGAIGALAATAAASDWTAAAGSSSDWPEEPSSALPSQSSAGEMPRVFHWTREHSQAPRSLQLGPEGRGGKGNASRSSHTSPAALLAGRPGRHPMARMGPEMRTTQTVRNYTTASPVDEGEDEPISTQTADTTWAPQGQPQRGRRRGKQTHGTRRKHASCSRPSAHRASDISNIEVAVASLRSDIQSILEESKKQKSDLDDLKSRGLTAYADAIMEFVDPWVCRGFLLGFGFGFSSGLWL